MDTQERRSMVGTVKWFSSAKGYGFITSEGLPDVFVHYSVIEAEGYRSLRGGWRVEFELRDSERGPAAARVKRIDEQTEH